MPVPTAWIGQAAVRPPAQPARACPPQARAESSCRLPVSGCRFPVLRWNRRTVEPRTVEPQNPGTLEPAVHDLPGDHRELTPQILECRGSDRAPGAIPHRGVGVLAVCERADASLEKHLPRRPDRVRLQRVVDV